MIYKNKSRKPLRIIILSFLLIFSLSFTAFASSDVNTDSDTEPVDGSYEFTGNGDWYGYTSYLYLDGDQHTIRGRDYEVTLPEDGRLLVELQAEKQNLFLI